MKASRITFALVLAHFLFLIPVAISGQTERVDIIEYTPPKGWARTPKDAVVVYTNSNKSTNALCVLSVYPSSPSAGSPQKDFANQWNELIVKPFKADANPKTETQTEDGWTSVSGGAEIESDGNKLAVLMTVVSGYGRAASVFVILNNQEYVPQIDAFMNSIKMDKARALASTNPALPPTSTPASKGDQDFIDFDPFPDKPYVQPQKPLIGRLRKTITMDDLAGTWELGGAAVTTYVSAGTGTYTDASFFGKKYFIRADGTYESKFQGRASNTTIRESDSGTVILSGGFITMKSRQNPAMRYQFVAFMSQPNGAAVLSLIYIGENAPLDGEALRANCHHAKGYVSCLNGEEWLRLP